ncbi:hypothetical protein BAG01nite_03160 [Brevibacillus agri]|uniref:DUF817 domain-containing protein n=1 Tax=Brevibacillus agri TaxID=51101 RepID=A0A3M8AQ10_9BACL|nr:MULTISPECIES: DUF817 domain-containing protein [Brevibacillus]ELK43650.1 hypothetical protein D478_01462 [Brevibacillus agri BAB-2500]EJL41279.1 putative integral membrane protein [Brevibacillus sp. CF112]MBG9568920.1 hypothetical protein [Brevibacillus agri]MBY0051431.1 DUF817 domain-containing protein [Brevibacillus agri]MCG5249778.1 DUF817 domain-containing protein [Brevibacillus agri]
MIRFIRLLLHFGYQEAMSCLFPVFIFASLAVSKFVAIPGLPRYDLLLLLCLAFQVFMVKSGLESRDELKVITVFHLIGLCLEIYKVHMGSWSYPEAGYSKVFGVPLYSGFMYASVASYLCQAWRRLDVSLTNWPKPIWVTSLGAAIYLNFFTHHFIWDLRWVLMVLMFIVFWRSKVYFRVTHERFSMPIPLGYFLIGFFIWIAENIATFFGAWAYPNQRSGWELVHLSKISSWFLLVIVSFIIVAELKHVKARRTGGKSVETK